MKLFFLQILTWWHGQTIGTRLHTWLRGRHVGTDEAGNRYYRHRRNDRRWVTYAGVVEASSVPPGWNAWLHHTSDVPPSDEAYEPHAWELPHLPNMTGTPLAYRPPGSIMTPAERPRVTGDYDPWTPAG